MLRYIGIRIGQSILTMFIVSLLVFSIVRLTGDPLEVLVPDEAPREMYIEMAALLHLDRPLPEQYWLWMSNILTGDLGRSTTKYQPVSKLILERIPATLRLGSVAVVITLILGLSVGVYSAAFRGTVLDYVARFFAVLGQAAPNFWLGILGILFFAVWLRWLPAGGKEDWKSFILPAFTLGIGPVAALMRLTRSAMLEVLSSEYVKLARIKGVPEPLVLWKHGFKNASITVLTFTSLLFINLLRGSVLAETIFVWPGVGRLTLEAVYNRDFPVVQAVVLMFSGLFVFGNLVVDILYVALNPKVRLF